MKKIAIPFLIVAFFSTFTFAHLALATAQTDAFLAKIDAVHTKLDSIADRLAHVETMLVSHNVDVTTVDAAKAVALAKKAQVSADLEALKTAVTAFAGDQSTANRQAVHTQATTTKTDLQAYVSALKAVRDTMHQVAAAAGLGGGN